MAELHIEQLLDFAMRRQRHPEEREHNGQNKTPDFQLSFTLATAGVRSNKFPELAWNSETTLRRREVPASKVVSAEYSAELEQFGSRDLARCGRKLYDERRAPAQFTLASDPAVHGFHHLLHDGQAQAG